MADDPNLSQRSPIAPISGPALYAAVGAIAALAGIGLGWGLWGRTPRAELVTPPPREVTAQPVQRPVEFPQQDLSAFAPVVVQPTVAGPPTPIVAPAPAAQPPQPVQQPQQQPEPPPAVVTPAAPLPVSEQPDPPAPNLTRRINVNTASQAELELLPGIGPALATRIIEHRTANGRFKTVDSLDAVKGIGPKMLEKLRPLVSVD